MRGCEGYDRCRVTMQQAAVQLGGEIRFEGASMLDLLPLRLSQVMATDAERARRTLLKPRLRRLENVRIGYDERTDKRSMPNRSGGCHEAVEKSANQLGPVHAKKIGLYPTDDRV